MLSWAVIKYKKAALGLLKIKELKQVILHHPDHSKLDAASKIVNKNLSGNRGLLSCQEELFDNGLKEYARL